jgi:hypothetical protein
MVGKPGFCRHAGCLFQFRHIAPFFIKVGSRLIDEVQKVPDLLDEVHSLIEAGGFNDLSALSHGEFISALQHVLILVFYTCQEALMQTKLTLTLDGDVIRQAKHYAKDHHTSLSRMVQSFFMGIAREGSEIQLSGVAHELSGVLRDTDLPDLKKFKKQRLSRKYGI